MNPSALNYDPSGYGVAYPVGDGSQYYENNPYVMYDNPTSSSAAGYGTEVSPAAGGGGMYYTENGYYVPTSSIHQEDTYSGYQRDVQQLDLAATTEPGSYYPIANVESSLLFGSAVTAVAYDRSFDAIYASTVTTQSGISSSTTSSLYNQHRRLPQRTTMTVTHSLSDTDGVMLYSSVASHPEAPSAVLNAIYRMIYGSAQPDLPGKPIPKHAYVPPYGATDPALPDSVVASASGTGRGGNFQMGVRDLEPVSEGHVASVSAAGVRIHTVGGLQLADLHLEGMLAAAPHPSINLQDHSSHSSGITHLMVGGAALSTPPHLHTTYKYGSQHHLHCLDVWQGLQVVTSHILDRTNTQGNASIAVTALAPSYSRGCVAVGCSDGYVRLVDDRNRDLAKIKSHGGGVVAIAVSDDGALVATTGYGSTAIRNATTPLYGYPDPTILVNDIRYIGRGGFPHPFAGLRGGPRHLKFLPEVQGQLSNRLLVASGQTGGGCQIIVPFQEASASNTFILPSLERGEAISSMCITNDRLALGTSQGKVLQYCMAGFYPKAESLASGTSRGGVFVPTSTKARGSEAGRPNVKLEKKPLVLPPFSPPLSDVPLEATLLLTEEPSIRMGETEKIKSIFGAYTFTGGPSVSAVARDKSPSSFGPLSSNPLVAQCRFKVSANLSAKASHTMDFVETIPMSVLGVDIFDDHRPAKHNSRRRNEGNLLHNSNKLIYNNELFKVAYGESFNRAKRYERLRWSYERPSTLDATNENRDIIPQRFRLTLRSTHKSAASFRHSEYNQSGTVPGYDYPIMLSNSFVPPVLLLLYFIPELREAALKAQLGRALSSPREQGLVTELGYLFHRIDMLAQCGPLFGSDDGGTDMIRIEAWSPTSFISFLTTMPEAERFQILDGSPAAIDAPRRPEAFYRFLMYQLDTEISKGRSNGLLDSLSGIDFLSINEFISGSGPPSKSTTRQLTVELSYDYFFGSEYKTNHPPSFGDVLQYNLCRANRLRAWSQSSMSYETIVQRKIATSLPVILSLSAACAGRKEEEGLSLWRNELVSGDHWLPEIIEVEIKDNGSVVVREQVFGTDSWKASTGSGSMTAAVTSIVNESIKSGGPRKRQYRLDVVVSMIRDDQDRSCPEEVLALEKEGPFGHHILHARVSKAMKERILRQQLSAIQNNLSNSRTGTTDNDRTLMGRCTDLETLRQRIEHIQQGLASIEEEPIDPRSEWVLVNGFVVTNTTSEDARAFEASYREPSLVVFRALDEMDTSKESLSSPKLRGRPRKDDTSEVTIPPEIIQSTSITNSSKSTHSANQKLSVLPSRGDLIAFDAEFVAVAEEESILTATGTKLTIRETRHALARISVLDGRPASMGSIILDDHVQPNEPVTDYLTRFSGIVARDLSPKHSRHHLITARTAYLKLRCFIERGCIFVGHGLQQDFWTANLAVPANQIIDTLEIYHKPAQRHISLRFLTNYILKRDMQQEVHNSVEDAQAALALYQKAIQLKRSGEFERVLDELYEYGQKCDWKLGVHSDDP